MQQDCWNRIGEIFEQAIMLDPKDRREFIEQECGSDEELTRELLSLVENHENLSDFLDDSVFSIGFRLL